MKKMKLFFDTTPLMHYPCGISIFTIQMLSYLLKNTDVELHTGIRSCNFKMMADFKQRLFNLSSDKITWHSIFFPPRLNLEKTPFQRYFSFRPEEYDLMYYPTHVAPYYVPPADFSNTILTVHDMFLWHSEYNDQVLPPFLNYLKRSLPEQARKARAIVTVSNFSKQEMISFLGIPEEKIHVIPIATQWDETLSSATSELLHKLNVKPGSYFLSVSSLDPHKNFESLCKAFSVYHNSADYGNEKLIIVGKRKPGDDKLYQLFQNTPDLIHLSGVDEADLKALYENAKGFFLVSKLEGFGIPLLEAMSCKTPACYGLGSSMDEIGRDAAYGVEPENIDAIAEVFKIFSANPPELQKRVESAYPISLEYSWENAVKRLYDLFQDLSS